MDTKTGEDDDDDALVGLARVVEGPPIDLVESYDEFVPPGFEQSPLDVPLAGGLGGRRRGRSRACIVPLEGGGGVFDRLGNSKDHAGSAEAEKAQVRA